MGPQAPPEAPQSAESGVASKNHLVWPQNRIKQNKIKTPKCSKSSRELCSLKGLSFPAQTCQPVFWVAEWGPWSLVSCSIPTADWQLPWGLMREQSFLPPRAPQSTPTLLRMWLKDPVREEEAFLKPRGRPVRGAFLYASGSVSGNKSPDTSS